MSSVLTGAHLRSAALPTGAALLGAGGIGAYLCAAEREAPLGLGALLYPIALALVLGIFELTGRALGSRRGRWAPLVAGARVAWPAAPVFALLPLGQRLPGVVGEHSGLLLSLVAMLVLAFRVDRRLRRASPIAVTPIRPRGGSIGIWELSLLLATLGASVLYLRIGASAEGNFQNDSAYYFGVARHMAMTKRFEEPIVWHFAHPPATLVHAPFDYWGGLTSSVLAPVLAIFGPTQKVAFLAMATISALSLVAFWYLVCVALPVRYALVQLIALGSFAFSTSAHSYRFDTESLPLYHLVLILAVIGLAIGRPLLAIVFGFALALCRVDGMVPYVGICLLAVERSRQLGSRQLRRAGWLAGSLLAAYLARNLVSFGTLLPPGSSAAALLADQRDLYAWHRAATPTSATLLSRLGLDYALARLGLLVDNLRSLDLVPAQPYFFLLAVLPGVRYFRRRARAAGWILGGTLGTAYVLAWASGPLFHPWRTLSALLPLIVASCALGASALCDWLLVTSHRLRRGRSRYARTAISLAASVATLLCVYPVASRITPYGPRARAALRSKEIALSQLSERLGGAAVAATDPWYVMAQTRSPVVSIPEDGEASIAEVLRRYSVEWLIVVHNVGYLRASASVIQALRTGRRTTIGEFHLERVEAGGSLAVFRVHRPVP